MPIVSIELPDDLDEFVRSQVKQAGFASASDYLIELVRAAKNNVSSLELALLEGLNSGPSEDWSPEEWQAMKDRIRARHQ